MDYVSRGEFPIPKVEGDALTQEERPLLHIRAGLPLLRQARDKPAGLGVYVQQGLQKGVKLEMRRAANGPEAVALVEPSRNKHQPPYRWCGGGGCRLGRSDRGPHYQ